MPSEKPSLAEIRREIQERGVTTAWFTASVFQLLVDQELDAFRGMRQILAGGEVLPPEPVLRVLQAFPGCSLINGYGPTENTTFTTTHSMATVRDVGLTVSLGRPIPNTRVYLLDQDLQPVPIGVPGELFAGGDGVARGYWRRPGLTAERFVPDPFAAPGSRMYRTGDRARFHSDGTLEFLGRVDHQIKLRGFRIELEEIESVMGSMDGIRSAVVLLREDLPGGRALAAFYSVRNQAIEPAELRRKIQPLLPEYMVPSFFVCLGEMPLNTHGKVDRAALDALPVVASPGVNPPPPAPPVDDIERSVLAIWREVLASNEGGMNDDFFEQGGHSLKATRMISQIRSKLRVELPLRTLFETPTPRGLSEAVKRGGTVPPGLANPEPVLGRRSRVTAGQASGAPLQG